nr:MAG TPA: hypothetical protein [Microviridae sp.]
MQERHIFYILDYICASSPRERSKRGKVCVSIRKI